MDRTWDDEAGDWIRWARSPADAYWHYSSAFFDEIVPAPNGRTLEIGCGEGRVTRDLRDRGHEVTALDSSPTLLRHAARSDPRSRYLVARGEALPFPGTTFGVVVAYNSIMDVDDMVLTVSECARVLVPGGRLCICVTHPINDSGRWHGTEPDAPFVIEGTYFGRRRMDETFERDGLRMTFHGWLYPLQAYTAALEDAGLVIERLREPQPGPDVVKEHSSLARWTRVPMFLFVGALKR